LKERWLQLLAPDLSTLLARFLLQLLTHRRSRLLVCCASQLLA
jgi:hypothetical protein